MHRSMRDGLEDLLAGKSNNANGSNGLAKDVLGHLAECSGCLGEFRDMKAQSELFRSLSVPEELDPTPGFYARVMQRIEEHASIWAVFIYSPFGKRFSLSLVQLSFGSRFVCRCSGKPRRSLDWRTRRSRASALRRTCRG